MDYPTLEEFIEYINFISGKENKNRKRFKRIYKNAKKHFKTPEDLVKASLDQVREMELNSLLIFVSLKLGLRVSQCLEVIRLYEHERIIEFFGLVNESFMQAYNQMDFSKHKRNRYKANIIKMLMFLGKKSVSEINKHEIIQLKKDDFYKVNYWAKRFVYHLELTLNIKTGKSYTQFNRIQADRPLQNIYTGQSLEILNAIEKYIEYKVSCGISRAEPFKALKTFTDWLFSNHGNCVNFNQFTKIHLEDYKEFVLNNESFNNNTRRRKINNLINLLKWLQLNKFIDYEIVSFDETANIPNNITKPRMFQERKDFMKILSRIMAITTDNERDELYKHLFLIASATGLRVSEVVWLGPGCIKEVNNEVGEILLQTQEKLGIRNKPVSILPWGIKSIKFLEERFKTRKNLEFYHKKTGKYFPSLFEYNGRIISIATASDKLKKILAELELAEEYKGVKFHGFRHQKFNDIYEVTGGSLYAVKLDSNHATIGMAGEYTRQGELRRQAEAYKLLEEGKIVGKGALILKSLLKSSYSPERYRKVLSKMSACSHLTNEGLNGSMRYLGFGFCNAVDCEALAPYCEECDYFWTCETFKEDLKKRFAINFILIKNKIKEIMQSKSMHGLIRGLKYQQKWLREIGLSEEEIEALKKIYIEEDMLC